MPTGRAQNARAAEGLPSGLIFPAPPHRNSPAAFTRRHCNSAGQGKTSLSRGPTDRGGRSAQGSTAIRVASSSPQALAMAHLQRRPPAQRSPRVAGIPRLRGGRLCPRGAGILPLPFPSAGPWTQGRSRRGGHCRVSCPRLRRYVPLDGPGVLTQAQVWHPVNAEVVHQNSLDDRCVLSGEGLHTRP